MQRAAAIADIHRTLGYRSDKQDEIVLALQKAQNQLELGAEIPWFLEAETTLSTAIDNPLIPLPTDFLIERAPGPSIKGRYLIKSDEREAKARGGWRYVLLEESLKLFPTPQEEYEVEFPYFRRDQSLSSDIQNRWLKYAPLVLIGSAGLLVAADLRNQTAMAKFQDQLTMGLELLHRHQGLRETANRKIVLGRKA